MPTAAEKPMTEKEEKPDFIKAQARFICRHALWIVIAFTVATVGLIPVASRLKLHANFLDLLPPTHPSIVNLQELMKHVGGTSFLIAIIESPDEQTSLEATKRFSQKAAKFRQIEYVDNRTDIPAFENRKLLFLKLESVRELKKKIQDLVGYYRRKSNPFYLDLVEEKAPVLDPNSLELEEKVSRIGGFSAKEKDSYMQVVLLKPKHPVSDFTKTKQLFEEIAPAFAEIKKDLKHPVTLGFTGPYRTRYEEYKTIIKDLRQTGTVATILLIVINILAFRNLRSIIYAYLPLAVGTVWIWAFTQVSIGYLNLITAFLAAILFGMGGDYTFHILVSFEEDFRLTGNPEKAVEMTYSELWHPLWSSMWTTAVVFYAMIISQFEGFRHFGIIAGIGIVISFVIVLFLQPALIVLGEKYLPKKRKPLGKEPGVSKPLIYTVIAAGILFTIYSLVQIPQAKFDYDFKDLQAKDDDSIELADKIGSHFGVHLTPVVFMTPNRAMAADLAVKINHSIDTHPGTLFDFAAAITSHVPRDQEAKIQVLGEIKGILDKYKPLLKKQDADTQHKIKILEQQLQPQVFRLEDLPDGIQGQYEGTDHQISTVFVYPAQRIFNGEVAKRFVQEARSFPVPEGVKVAGEAVIYADILSLMERDTPIALGISTLVVFLLVLRHFWRLDHTFWVHAPLVIGGFWMIGMISVILFIFLLIRQYLALKLLNAHFQ